jgi:hypothetical protein
MILHNDGDGWGPDLYDDGVFTYTAPKRSDFHKAFKKLEREYGIDTKRVKREKKADIICEWGQLDTYAGYAEFQWNKYGRRWKQQTKLTVEPGHWYSQSTVVHEIGHALGLDHPQDMTRTDTIMSYGAPGDLPWFTPLDEYYLDILY